MSNLGKLLRFLVPAWFGCFSTTLVRRCFFLKGSLWPVEFEFIIFSGKKRHTKTKPRIDLTKNIRLYNFTGVKHIGIIIAVYRSLYGMTNNRGLLQSSWMKSWASTWGRQFCFSGWWKVTLWKVKWSPTMGRNEKSWLKLKVGPFGSSLWGMMFHVMSRVWWRKKDHEIHS